MSVVNAAGVTVGWMCTASLVDERSLEPWQALLPPQEREQAARQVYFEDRRDRICARALLRLTLSRFNAVDPRDWVVARQPSGRPEVLGPEGAAVCAVSLSHSRGWVACAVGQQGPLGVDVEHSARAVDLDLLLPEVCRPDEHRWVEQGSNAAERVGRFRVLWTLKEASLKASGLGLGGGLKSGVAAGHDEQARALHWWAWQRDGVSLALVNPMAQPAPEVWSPPSAPTAGGAWELMWQGCGHSGWPSGPASAFR